MAIVNAVATGNYSDYAVTFGGVVPQPGDTVRAGNFIISINISTNGIIFDCNGSGYFQIRQTEVNSAGGILNLADCDFLCNSASIGISNLGLRISHDTGSVIFRDLTHVVGGNGYCGISGGGSTTMRKLTWLAAGLISVVTYTGSGTLTIDEVIVSGNVTGASPSSAALIHGGVGVVVVRNAYHGLGTTSGPAHGIVFSGSGVLEVDNAFGGNVVNIGGASDGVPISVQGTGIVRITNAYAGNISSRPAIRNDSGEATIYIENAIGNNFGPGGGTVSCSAYSGGNVNRSTRVFIKRLIFGPYGAIPVSGTVFIDDSLDNSVQLRLSSNGPTKTLVDSNLLNNVPNISDVRSGTSYSNGDNVGTCGVPLPEQVAYGIPVDDTVGTAVLLPSVFPTADEISNFVHSDDLRDYELDPHTIAEALNIISKSIGAT